MIQLLLAIVLLFGGGATSKAAERPLLIGYHADGSFAFATSGRELTPGMVEQVWHGGSLSRNVAEGECAAPADYEIFTVAAMGLKEYRVQFERYGKHWQARLIDPGKLDNAAAKALYQVEFAKVSRWLGSKERCRAIEVTIGRVARKFGAIFKVEQIKG